MSYSFGGKALGAAQAGGVGAAATSAPGSGSEAAAPGKVLFGGLALEELQAAARAAGLRVEAAEERGSGSDGGEALESPSGKDEADDDAEEEEEEEEEDEPFEYDAEAEDALVLLATDGDLSLVKAQLDSGRSTVNDQDSNGYNALMAAASYGHTEVVRFLLSVEGCDVNLCDAEGDTALHYCTDLECAKLLVGAGVNLSIKNNQDMTALEAMEDELQANEYQEGEEEEEDDEAAQLKLVVAFLRGREVNSTEN
jgi:hypothetical protein